MRRIAILTGVLALALVLAFAGAAMAQETTLGTLTTEVKVQEEKIVLEWATLDEVNNYVTSVTGQSPNIPETWFRVPSSKNGGYTLTITKDKEYYVAIKATSDTPINNVLYRMEIKNSLGQLVPNVITGLQGYAPADTSGTNWTWQNVEKDGDRFFWGPSTGFTFPGGTVVTPFRFKFVEPGTYTVTIYAVKLQ